MSHSLSSMEHQHTTTGTSEAESASNPDSTRQLEGDGGHNDAEAVNDQESAETVPSDRRKEILKVLEVVERDSAAIADNFSSLFASLRLSLSQASSCTVDHMNCFGDATGRLQECVLDASTKGNRYINSCLRLNEEMKGMDALAIQLKILRRHVDALDSAVNRIVRFP